MGEADVKMILRQPPFISKQRSLLKVLRKGRNEMERIVTGKEMKALDAYTINHLGIPSLVLMERAALAVTEAMKDAHFPLNRVLVLCGSGNNGADGVAIARMLHLSGYCVDVSILGNQEHFTPEMKKQIEIGKNYGLSFVNTFHLHEYTTIVDAIFGVGLSRTVSGKYQEVMESLKNYRGKIVAVDIPSGICADTGAVLGCGIQADLTVTFAYKKAGLCFYPGASYAGQVLKADIGIYDPKESEDQEGIYALEKQDFRLLSRKADGNKGTFGKILLIAGSKGMFGAAYLSGMAAMKTGAGMLKICTSEENRSLFSCFPEAMLLTYQEDTDIADLLGSGLCWADAVGIGPGLGRSSQAARLLDYVLSHSEKPLVIDADGLNLLKGHLDALKGYQGTVILTPHLGELSRLTGISPEEWKKNPLNLTKTLAKELSAVLICKDARTVIGTSKGSCCINLSGNDGMATAGSGDVLTGILVSLLAQGYEPDQAACLGVYLHGAAGDLAAKNIGKAAMLASDIVRYTGEILKTETENGQRNAEKEG